MRKISAAAVCIAVGLFCSGCDGVPENEDREQTGREAQQYDGTENAGADADDADAPVGEEEVVELTPAELAYFQNMISGYDPENAGGYGFLLSSYTSPEEINWNEVFYSGAGGASLFDMSEEEQAAYLEASGLPEIYTDVTKLTAEQIENFVQDRTGTSYRQAKRPLNWVYLEKYDAYYFMHGDTNYREFACVDGTKQGDWVRLYVMPAEDAETGHGNDYELVLRRKPSGDGYYFYANRLLWEEGILEEQSFLGLEFSEYDEPVNFVIYPPSEDNTDVTMKLIVKDEVVQNLYTGLPTGVDEAPFVSVDAVSFPDYDRDGNTDIIVIRTIEGGRVVNFYDGYTPDKENEWDNYFRSNTSLADAVMRDIPEDISISNIRQYIGYGNKEDTFASWQEAYAFIARLSNLQDSDYDYSYDLIYFDEDTVPELVVDLSGYRVSMYTYAEGRLYRVMKEWGYGVGGNAGYEYLPYGNRLLYGGNAYAGLIHYDYIYRLSGEHRLEEVVSLETLNFDDRNGNHTPDEGEEEFAENGGGSYIDGRRITEEEYRSYFEGIGQTEWIGGAYGYEELLRQLNL